MKNLLIAGNTASLAPSLCQRLSGRCRVVVAAREAQPMAFGQGVESFALSGGKTLKQAFETHAFDAMVFLTTRDEQQASLPGEADLLSAALALAQGHGIFKVLVVTSGELSREKDASSERGLLIAAMEQLCAAYRAKGLHVAILRLPLVFGPGETDTLIGRMVLMAARGEAAAIPYSPDAQADFISAAEVSQLIVALLDREEALGELIPVRGAETLSVKELTALFQLLGAQVSHGDNEAGCPPMEPGGALECGGFGPIERLSVELDSLFAAAKAAYEKQRDRKSRMRSFLARRPALIRGASLVLGYGALEGLKILQAAGRLPAMDLSLLYVALIGAAHGLQTGLCAVILASFSLAFQYGAQGADIRALLSDYTALLPFLTLLLAGAACGWCHDRGWRAARMAREDAATLRQRCDFLQELYKQQLLAKEKPSLPGKAVDEWQEGPFAQPILAGELPEAGNMADAGLEQAEEPPQEPVMQGHIEEPKISERERLEEIRIAHKKAEESRRAEQARLKQALADLKTFEPPLEEEDTLTIAASFAPEDVFGSEEAQEEPEDQGMQGYREAWREEPRRFPDPVPVPVAEPVPVSTSVPVPAPNAERRRSQGSPFGAMSMAERRRMLEAMQVRARTRAAGKGR